MGFDHAGDVTKDTTSTSGSGRPAAGKRTLTQRLPPASSGAGHAATIAAKAGASVGVAAHDDPFGHHLGLDDPSTIVSLLARVGAQGQRLFETLLTDGDPIPGGPSKKVVIDREHVVAVNAHAMGADLAQVEALLAGAGAPAIARAVEGATLPAMKIRHWIDQRQANVGIKATFALLVLEPLDRLRTRLGLKPTQDIDAPAMPQKEVEEAGQEERDIEAAGQALQAKLITLMTGFDEGVKQFNAFAVLKRLPPEPSFWKELAKGIAVSVIGNILGPVGGILDEKLAPKVAEESTKAVGDLIAGTTTDSVEAIGGKIADGALEQATKSENQLDRDRVLFAQSLVLTQSALNEHTWTAISDAIANKTASTAAFKEIASKMDTTNAEITQLAYRHAAHGFSLMQAHRSLGTVHAKDGEAMKAMADVSGYQGEVHGSFRSATRIGDKRGSTGVGRVDVTINSVNGQASVGVNRFRINGMNDDMAKAVLARAGHQLGKLQLPLEISIDPFGMGETYGRPMVVIDEAGVLQDVIGWAPLAERTKKMSPPPNGSEVYADGPSLWKFLGGIQLSANAARTDKGG